MEKQSEMLTPAVEKLLLETDDKREDVPSNTRSAHVSKLHIIPRPEIISAPGIDRLEIAVQNQGDSESVHPFPPLA